MTAPAATEDDFFGPFLRIFQRFPRTPVFSLYDEAFHDFLGPMAWPQEWDIPALTQLTLCGNPSVVVDLGCGDGRVSDRLRRVGYEGELLGVDSNPFATSRYSERFAKDPRVIVRSSLDSALETYSGGVDVVVMGSVTVNSFSDDSALRELFKSVRSVLSKHRGVFVLLAYRDSVIKEFERLGTAIDAVEFTDSASGIQRLIWRGVDFNAGRLRQNYFIETFGVGFPGRLGLLREHVWTSSEVESAAEEAGLTLVDSRTASVDSGAAAGWVCDAMRFMMAPG